VVRAAEATGRAAVAVAVADPAEVAAAAAAEAEEVEAEAPAREGRTCIRVWTTISVVLRPIPTASKQSLFRLLT
jgi:hypothetical protein